MLFRFSIADLATFLGKSPVTIRAWERKGLVKLPRVGNTRMFSTGDIRDVARIAHRLGRISDERWTLINEATGSLNAIEMEKK